VRWRTVAARSTFRDRTLSAASQAGLVNNLNDGLAWGLLPLFYASHGLSIDEIGILAAAYPAVWGLGQVGTGALSDRVGRKGLIVTGLLSIVGLALATQFVVGWGEIGTANGVAITGWGQAQDRNSAMKAGFDHHLTKPVDVGTLLKLLAAADKSDADAIFG